MKIYITSKRLFQDLQSASQTKEGKEFWGKRIAFCNKKMAQEMAKSIRAMVIIINVAVLLTIIFFSEGCQTAKGFMGDSAWLIQKGADNITVQEK